MLGLRLLDEVAWHGTALPGGRIHALLAALASAEGAAVGEAALVEQVWGVDAVPANPAKALQVVVSRTRALTAPDVVVRTERGYRLGLAPCDVDALVLRDLAVAARAAEADGDAVAARDRARAALEVAGEAAPAAGALGDLRDRARSWRAEAAAVLGRALSSLGDHADALVLLESAPMTDEASTTARLRSVAAVRGVPAALEAYEAYRADLADRLGVDPGPGLQAVQADLLAADHPVRSGLRYDATSLVGRDEDLRALRAAVRDSRVVSILGPGGLGKTRLAHLLGQEADQPVVHFVELVGVASAEDVASEVGSAIGVRDSVSGRRVLTAEQRRDARARIAQALDRTPTLLILDNCEHVVEAVADLVAYLVATVRRLHVVTTTRAPLAISAERVFPLDQLDEAAGVDLFVQRARAARPGVSLDLDPDGAVRRVVRRLDGLPLALELAAAKIRVMSVEDVDHRLDDRFALLRGGDRSAPDRHQTLVAVIDWSWNLLAEDERRALRWLSVFHDGFTLAAAEVVLGRDPLAAVQSLVDQSLLTVLDTVLDTGATVRFRMLETVREFGRMQLVGAGEEDAAADAQTGWARGFARRQAEALWTTGQVRATRAMAQEETNLADVLRRVVAVPDPGATAELTAALAGYWTIRGDTLRVIGIASAIDAALAGWEPASDEIDAAVTAAAMTVMNAVVGEISDSPSCQALMVRYGTRARGRHARGLVAVLSAQTPGDSVASLEQLARVTEADGHDRHAVALARLWSAHYLENEGDPERALAQAEQGLALVGDDDGPWLAATIRTVMAGLTAQLGRREETAVHARAAISALDELDANDDAIQSRALLVGGEIAGGRLAEAERLIEEIEAIDQHRSGFGSTFVLSTARAELALAGGDIQGGLRLYREAAVQLRSIRLPEFGLPTGLEPWALFGDAAGATAYALHGRGTDGADLYASLLAKATAVVDPGRPGMDYPVAGMVLHGLGAWGLLKGVTSPEEAIDLLVLAEQFAYPRFTPTLDPARTEAAAERLAPGLGARLREQYADRRGPALLPAAQAAVARVTHLDPVTTAPTRP